MGYSPWGHKESDTIEQLTLYTLRGLKVILHGAGEIVPE